MLRLAAAETLIAANAEPARIAKQHVSMYETADPVVRGGVGAWHFSQAGIEADAIAQSIQRLCAAGMAARDIMVLLSNARTLMADLQPALDARGIAYELPRTTPFKDTDTGRAVLTALRLGTRDDDFVALRTLLELRKRVGIVTAAAIGDAVIAANISYRDAFDDPDEQVFDRRQMRALGFAAEVVAAVREWGADDLLIDRIDDIEAVLPIVLGQDPDDWRNEVDALPDEATLSEALQYLSAEKDEQRARVLAAIHRRLGEDVGVEDLLPDAVRLMTMHGAKGLSAKIVFIPGLEQEMLPGPRRRPYPGLVLEAARMLYVSITRARLGCILSYADVRTVNGAPTPHHASEFTRHIGQPFSARTSGMDIGRAEQAVAEAAHL